MRIKLFLFGLFILTWPFLIKAQQDSKAFVLGNKNYDQFVGSTFHYDMGSTGLNNAILFKFAFGGKISAEQKDAAYNRMKFQNIFGQYSSWELFYRQENRKLIGLEQAGLQFGIAWHNYSEIAFTSDAFQLLFNGNMAYSGKHALLSQSGVNFLNYYQLKAGINHKSPNEKHQFSYLVALNLGNRFNQGNFSDASFYTSETGDSLSLDGNLQYNYIESQSDSYFDIFGFGAGIDFSYIYKSRNHMQIEVEVKQLGFIAWNKKQNKVDYSEPIIWEGIPVENILQLPEPLMETSASDSIQNFLDAHGNQGGNLTLTPAHIRLAFSYPIQYEKLHLFAQYQYRFFSYYRSEFALEAHYWLSEYIQLKPGIYYGGYNKFNIGLGAGYQTKKDLKMGLDLRYISGLIFQQKAAGIGAFITFTQQF